MDVDFLAELGLLRAVDTLFFLDADFLFDVGVAVGGCVGRGGVRLVLVGFFVNFPSL